MKRINIQSLLQAKNTLSDDSFNNYLSHYGIEIKAAEIIDIGNLANAMKGNGCEIEAFDKFYIGYKIPQIGKEFDLLRFGKNSIINIEIKNTCTEEKAHKQLLRNNYYLQFTGRTIHTFTFVSKSNTLFFLDNSNNLSTTHPNHLLKLISDQEIDDSENPDSLFDPSDYLVSPFNSTGKFLAGEYFLTHQQEEIKTKILASLALPKSARFISITGSAGTGKTLLTYDIARSLIENGGSPLIIHCGQLNRGHIKLSQNGWKIIPIKNYSHYNLEHIDLVIIDEAQRIYQKQFDDIVQKTSLAKCSCIFSYDKVQTLANWEENNNIAEKIDSISPITQYKLSEKIRTNKEIAAFIKMLFNNKTTAHSLSNGNIEINYFNTTEDAREYLEGLDPKKWEILRFTPSQYNNEHHEQYFNNQNKTSHEVIGQEFDGVAIAIDRYFKYHTDGRLIYIGKAYYAPKKMLFQNITRARKRLNLVIIDNEELLSRCISILH